METRAHESLHVVTRTSVARAWWGEAWRGSWRDASWRRSPLHLTTVRADLGGLR